MGGIFENYDPAAKSANRFANASLLLSCCTLFGFLIPALFLCAVGGVVCGHLAHKKTNWKGIKTEQQSRAAKFAFWGLAIGYTSIIWVPLVLIVVIYVFGLPHGEPVWRR